MPKELARRTAPQWNECRHVRRNPVKEAADVPVFFRPGGLIFYVHGGAPALIKIMSLGTILPFAAPFAQLFTDTVKHPKCQSAHG
jgi:hypothetical protein